MENYSCHSLILIFLFQTSDLLYNNRSIQFIVKYMYTLVLNLNLSYSSQDLLNVSKIVLDKKIQSAWQLDS